MRRTRSVHDQSEGLYNLSNDEKEIDGEKHQRNDQLSPEVLVVEVLITDVHVLQHLLTHAHEGHDVVVENRFESNSVAFSRSFRISLEAFLV